MTIPRITVFPDWRTPQCFADQANRWLETQSGREIDARISEMSDEDLMSLLAQQETDSGL